MLNGGSCPAVSVPGAVSGGSSGSGGSVTGADAVTGGVTGGGEDEAGEAGAGVVVFFTGMGQSDLSPL